MTAVRFTHMDNDFWIEMEADPNTLTRIPHMDMIQQLRDQIKELTDRVTELEQQDARPMVTYAHQNAPGGSRFRQYATDPLPGWAVDVKEV